MNTYWRWGTGASTSSATQAPNGSTRFWWQEGQKYRPLHEKASRYSCRQCSHLTRANPRVGEISGLPQRRYPSCKREPGDSKVRSTTDPSRSWLDSGATVLIPALGCEGLPLRQLGTPAMVSISTLTPGPNAATAKQARAGGFTGK